LLIDYELHPETLADRIHRVSSAMGLSEPDLEGRFDIESLRGDMVDIVGLEALLASKRDRYSLIIIDALFRAIPTGVNENDNAQMTQLYNRLDSYAKMTGSAICLVHHSSKGAQGDKGVTDVGSGAGAISRAADSHIILRPHEQEGMVVMEAVTRSFAQPAPISIRRDYPLWVACTAPPVLRQKTNDQSNRDNVTDLAVLESLTTAGADEWLSISQLRTRTGMGGERIGRSLSRLEREAKITRREEERKQCTVAVYRAITSEPNVTDNVTDNVTG
jgi:hypothetical protein